jgi:siroheme synthase
MEIDAKSKSWRARPGFAPSLLTVPALEYLQAAQLMAVEQIVQDELA